MPAPCITINIEPSGSVSAKDASDDLSATLLKRAGLQQFEDTANATACWPPPRRPPPSGPRRPPARHPNHLPAPDRPGYRAPDDLGLTSTAAPFPEQELPR